MPKNTTAELVLLPDGYQISHSHFKSGADPPTPGRKQCVVVASSKESKPPSLIKTILDMVVFAWLVGYAEKHGIVALEQGENFDIKEVNNATCEVKLYFLVTRFLSLQLASSFKICLLDMSMDMVS